jgi:hypothetical protein
VHRPVDGRQAVEQRARVRDDADRENLACRRAFDDPARIHDGDAVAHARDDAEVVRDEQHAHAGLALDVLQKLEVLRLDRDVERGGRLVGDQQRRIAGERDRAGDPLAHAAAQRVRVVIEVDLGIGDAHAPQGVDDLRPQRGAAESLMQRDRFRHLRATVNAG